MSAYNPPTETLPRFNTTAFIQNANVSYPVAQGALTIPKQIRIIDGSNTIIITPTSIIINGIVYSLTNIAYLNLSQTFTGVNSFSNSILTNNIDALTTTANASLFFNLTGRLFIGNPAGSIVVDGLNTTFTNALLCDTITSKLVGNAVSLFSTTTGGITFGSSSGTNTIRGNTTIQNTTTITTLLTNSINPVNPTNNIQIGNTQTTGTMNIASNTSGNITIGGLNSVNTYLFGTNVVIGFPSQTITLQGNTQSSGIFTAETIRPIVLSNPIKLYDTSTGNITIGNAGISTNTINGNTTITNTLLANTLIGKVVSDNISLYNTSTGTIVIGNAGVSNNTINGLSNYIEGATNTIVGTTNTIYGLSTFENDVTFKGSIICDVIKPYTTGVSGNLVLWDNALGNITIGNNASGITINGLTSLPNGIKTKTIRTASATDIVTLFDTSTSTITLGNTASTNTINGNTTMTNILSLTSIRAVTPSAGVFLFDNMTSGSITIGGASQTGTINIGTTGTNIIAINGGSFIVYPTMSVNTITGRAVGNAISLFTTTTGTITLGNAASTNTINGNTSFINTLLANTLTGRAVGNAISLFTTSTSTITLGNAASTNTINGNTTFNQTLSAPTPTSLLNTTRVPTTAYLTTYYAPLTGTIANATAITLTPNTTDTLGYITFSSTASGSSNIKTNTALIFNASTGKLSSSSIESNTIQGVAVGNNVSLYNTTTTGTIDIGGNNTSNINIGSSSGATSLKSLITYVNGTTICDSIQPNNSSSIVTLYTSPMVSLTIGDNTTSTTTIKGLTNTIFGDTSIINTLLGNALRGRAVADNITLYTTTTGTITLGNGTLSTNTITGLSNTITGLSNTINGDTIITDILDVNTIQGKAVADNIVLYNTTTGTITIGNAGVSTNTITGLANTITGNTTITNTLIVNTIHSIASGTTMNLCNNLTTGNIVMGSNLTLGTITIGRTAQTGNVTINGGQTGGTNSLFNNSTTSNVNIYTARTTGILTIGSSSTTAVNTNTNIHGTSVTPGVNNLFTNTRTANSNICTGVTTGRINLGTGLIATGGITIGSSLGTNTINGVTTITNTLDANTIEGTSPSSTINLYTNITTANSNILTGVTSGNINIGTGLDSFGRIIIGSVFGENTIEGNTRFTSTLFGNTIEARTTSATVNLYANVTTGLINFLSAITTAAINIGSSLQTGNMTIYGSNGGVNNLFTNSVTGTTSILTSNTGSIGSDLNIGNSANTGNLNFKWGNMYFTSPYFNFTGFFTVQRNASSLIYAPYNVETFTATGNQASPYGKFINCNYSVASQIMYLRAPDSQMEGMEFIIRFTNVAGSVSVLGAPTVFKNLSNTSVTSLSGSNVIRVICLSISSTYFWVQL